MIICYVLDLRDHLVRRRGRRRSLGHVHVFRAGVALSVAAFVWAALAPSFEWLLVARVVQGFGGGLIYGTAPALATLGAPASVRGRRSAS